MECIYSVGKLYRKKNNIGSIILHQRNKKAIEVMLVDDPFLVQANRVYPEHITPVHPNNR